MILKWIAPLAGALMIAGGSASAAVLSGTAGTGTFELITDTTGLSVGNDNQQENTTLFAFDEDQNIILGSALNLGTDFSNRTEYQFSIASGTVVASHYVFFDPAGTRSISGTVTFDADILGVAGFTGDLADTDFLANNSVTYLNDNLRGIEITENFGFDQDSYSISGDTLTLDFQASTPGDYIRVFTAQSPTGPAPSLVPLPAAGWVLVTGLAGLWGLRRRQTAA